MIDYIILTAYSPFAVIMQLHAGWVRFLQTQVLQCLGCLWFNRTEVGCCLSCFVHASGVIYLSHSCLGDLFQLLDNYTAQSAPSLSYAFCLNLMQSFRRR